MEDAVAVVVAVAVAADVRAVAVVRARAVVLAVASHVSLLASFRAHLVPVVFRGETNPYVNSKLLPNCKQAGALLYSFQE